jgi:hypothetical protein
MSVPPALEAAGARPYWRIWSIALACGIAAGLLAWLGEEVAHDAFKPQLYRTEILGFVSMQPSIASQKAADYKNSALTFFILGCATGLAMGVAGGLVARLPSRGLLVGLGAQAAGGLVAVSASLALVRLYYRHQVPDVNDLVTPALIQGGIWTPIGAVGGLAFAFGAGAGRRHLFTCIYSACIGAFLAAFLTQFAGAIVFPESRITDPVANSPLARLLATAMFSIMVAVGAAWGVLGARPAAPAPAAPGQ